MQVLIIQTLIKKYRVPFFERLHSALLSDGIRLTVAYGDPPRKELYKRDNVSLPAEFGIKTRNIWFCTDKILYQPLFGAARKADLVIAEQASKHLINYYLITLSRLKVNKFAYWGHGRNRHSNKYGLSERIKRALVNKVDWWFAYTNGTAEYLKTCGVPNEIITTVQNSVDTDTFKKQLEAVTSQDLQRAKVLLGIGQNAQIGLYCGALYEHKKLDFLLDSAKLIKREVPDFELIIMGGGPEANLIHNCAMKTPWLHYLGPRFGRDKCIYFKMSKVFLNPGLVGLAILDSFAAKLPLITTDIPVHSPEIDYLKNGTNGVMTRYDVFEYAQAVVKLFKQPHILNNMAIEASRFSSNYSIENMVDNFKKGILRCLYN
jgi:glycosyltransferase involved in cell wall biosynthesis